MNFFDITWDRTYYLDGNATVPVILDNIKFAFYIRYSTKRAFDRILRIPGGAQDVLRDMVLDLGVGHPQLAREIRRADEINLLWYLHAADYVMPSMEERHLVTQLSVDGLLELLGPQYRGPRDHASLIFAAISGRSTHRPASDDLPRYQDVIQYTDAQIGSLLDLYPITLLEDQWVSPYGPYVHVALQDPLPYEHLYATVTPQNVVELMETHGIIVGNPALLIGAAHAHDGAIKYFRREIKHYGPVLTRPAAQLPPPRLVGLNANQVTATLQFYTLREIAEAYEISQRWDNRSELTELVRMGAQTGSSWTMRHKWCNNDDTLNVEEGELHGAINKNDPNNPTLSYGLQMNYRCYQLEELILAWSPDSDGVIQFKVPDYNPRVPTHDPTTNGPLTQTFPLTSIQQLLDFLNNLRPSPSLRPFVIRLRDVVQAGIAYNNSTQVYFRMIHRQYETFTTEQQRLARIYLTWLFLFGMWIRFWRGPNHPWPYTQTIARTQAAVTLFPGAASICPRERNEHTFIQLAIKNKIMDQTDAPLHQWIQDLRFAEYNVFNGEVNLRNNGSLVAYIRSIETGQECQGYAGNNVPRTGYALISRLFGVTGTRFDQFIRENLAPVLDMEREVVTKIRNHLTGVLPEPPVAQAATSGTSNSQRGRRGRQRKTVPPSPSVVPVPAKPLELAETRTLDVATARLTELANPVQNLDPFDPTQLGESIHTADVFQG